MGRYRPIKICKWKLQLPISETFLQKCSANLDKAHCIQAWSEITVRENSHHFKINCSFHELGAIFRVITSILQTSILQDTNINCMISKREKPIPFEFTWLKVKDSKKHQGVTFNRSTDSRCLIRLRPYVSDWKRVMQRWHFYKRLGW